MDLTGIGSVADFFGKIVDKIWPDKTQADAAKAAFAQAQLAGQLQEEQAVWDNAKSQLEVNKQEAGSTSLFVSAWRPFVGWVCGFSLAYVSIVDPMARFAFQVIGHYAGPFPVIDTTITMQVLFGMLGLGAMRTIDKVKGVGSGH